MKSSQVQYTVALIVAAAIQSAFGQSTTGSVSGRIGDVSGAGVPGIKVELKNTQTGEMRESISNGSGD